jgi:hypothetical protein
MEQERKTSLVRSTWNSQEVGAGNFSYVTPYLNTDATGTRNLSCSSTLEIDAAGTGNRSMYLWS